MRACCKDVIAEALALQINLDDAGHMGLADCMVEPCTSPAIRELLTTTATTGVLRIQLAHPPRGKLLQIPQSAYRVVPLSP
ncbi:hypothetical protein AWV80_05090 [Cupriavidus sp. UYMU48A]|nr:hypothetical protein AWV80_05090 [Cupriavidus sp. UYMU48A]